MSDQLVTIYEADSQIEANIIEGILSQNGIPCTIRLVGLSGVFGGSMATPGAESHQIQVTKASVAQAEQIILDYQSPEDQE